MCVVVKLPDWNGRGLAKHSSGWIRVGQLGVALVYWSGPRPLPPWHCSPAPFPSHHELSYFAPPPPLPWPSTLMFLPWSQLPRDGTLWNREPGQVSCLSNGKADRHNTNRIKMSHVHVLTPHYECNQYVLKTCTSKKFKQLKINKNIACNLCVCSHKRRARLSFPLLLRPDDYRAYTCESPPSLQMREIR